MSIPGITIEPARLEDIQILNKISLESKRHWNYPEDWIENWKEDLKLKTDDFEIQHIFKAVASDITIGFCAIQVYSEHYEVNHLWVLPNYIGHGIGKTLLQHSINAVVDEPKDIHVISDPNSESFYAKLGFVTFDQVESYPIGRFLPLMKRPC